MSSYATKLGLKNTTENDASKLPTKYRKTVYDKLVAKLNTIDTTGFILKTKYTADKSDLEKK